MNEKDFKKIPVYDESDDEASDYIAIAYAKDMGAMKEFLTSQTAVVTAGLDWIIVTGGALITFGLRYRMEVYVGKK